MSTSVTATDRNSFVICCTMREQPERGNQCHVYVQMPACLYPNATVYQPKSQSLNTAINSQALVTVPQVTACHWCTYSTYKTHIKYQTRQQIYSVTQGLSLFIPPVLRRFGGWTDVLSYNFGQIAGSFR